MKWCKITLVGICTTVLIKRMVLLMQARYPPPPPPPTKTTTHTPRKQQHRKVQMFMLIWWNSLILYCDCNVDVSMSSITYRKCWGCDLGGVWVPCTTFTSMSGDSCWGLCCYMDRERGKKMADGVWGGESQAKGEGEERWCGGVGGAGWRKRDSKVKGSF